VGHRLAGNWPASGLEIGDRVGETGQLVAPRRLVDRTGGRGRADHELGHPHGDERLEQFAQRRVADGDQCPRVGGAVAGGERGQLPLVERLVGVADAEAEVLGVDLTARLSGGVVDRGLRVGRLAGDAIASLS
jgi:hypothetical protein